MSKVTPYNEPTSKLNRDWLLGIAENPQYGCVEVQPGIWRLPIARLAFAHLIEPKKNVSKRTNTITYDYQADFVFPPELDKDAFQPFLDAVHKAAVEKHGPDYARNRKFFHPLKDQPDALSSKGERWGGYADYGYYISARDGKNPPQVTDIHNKVITDASLVQSGVWGFPLVSIFGFDTDGNKGVSCGLRGFIFVAKDTILGGTVLDTEKAVEGLSGLDIPPDVDWGSSVPDPDDLG